MEHSIVYIGNPMPESYGVTIIVDRIASVFKSKGYEVEVIYNMDGLSKESYIIPYGIDMALEMVEKGYKTETVFLADAYTLGYINKIKFYLKHFRIFQYDFFYTIYSLLRDYRLETKIIKNFEKIVLVSETDINYLKKRAKPSVRFYCMPNGANFSKVSPKTEADTIRLGILSNWWHITLAQENGWFIEEYFACYVKRYPNVKLILAGRGSYIEKYKNVPNVEIMGEVDNLDDFFKNVDVYIVANPKGCGILNRALDAFAYKTCVIGYKKAFSGFRYMKDSYLEFDDYNSFEKQLNCLINDPERREILVNNAYKSIMENNNWEKNISNFIEFAMK